MNNRDERVGRVQSLLAGGGEWSVPQVADALRLTKYAAQRALQDGLIRGLFIWRPGRTTIWRSER